MVSPYALFLAATLLGACTHPGNDPPQVPAAVTPEPRAAHLQSRLTALAQESDGTFAVTVVHLPSGATASVNGDKRLPMMSVFKLPLAVVTLAAIDDGLRTMADPVPLTRDEIRSNVSPVAEEWNRGQTAPSLETLLRTVIQDSDNTSGDKLVTMNGGGPAITARLRKLGIDQVDIAEEEIDITARLTCAGAPRPASGWTEKALSVCAKAPTLAAARADIAAAPNGATTDALVAMLARIDRGAILSAQSRAWLVATLQGTKTGPGRIKGALPPGTRVAHKTGTGDTVDGLTMARNDIGIIQLPDGSRLCIAILTAGTRAPAAAVEAAMAKAARLAWDAFVPGGT